MPRVKQTQMAGDDPEALYLCAGPRIQADMSVYGWRAAQADAKAGGPTTIQVQPVSPEELRKLGMR